MENDLFELVARAQDGDKEALVTVISYIAPAIHGARCKMKGDRQDDLEQVIIETVIKKLCPMISTRRLTLLIFAAISMTSIINKAKRSRARGLFAYLRKNHILEKPRKGTIRQ